MFLLALVFAAAPPASDSTDKFVAQLGAEEQAQRQRASAALKSLGMKAYPHLVKATKSKDPEIRVRATEILSPIWSAELARASDRHVVMKAVKGTDRCFGVLLSA